VRLRFLSEKKASNGAKLDIEKFYGFNSLDTRGSYELEMKNRFEALGNLLPGDVDEQIETFNNISRESAEKTIGIRRQRKKPWLDEETMRLVDEKRALRAKTATDTTLKPKIREKTQEIKAKVKECRENWLNQICDEIEYSNKKGDLRAVYTKIKEVKGGLGLRSRNINVKDKDGNILSNTEDILNRWHEYCNGLYNYNLTVDRSQLDRLWPNTQDNEVPDLLKSEVRDAIKRLKPRKKPGIDEIEGELISHGGEVAVEAMYQICSKIWSTGQFPKLWTRSLIVLIHKKGDKTKCDNYRTISLICHASKIILQIIRSRMKERIESQMAEEQAGFRANRGTIEQIFSLRLIAEKYLELRDRDLYHIFIDFKKAFDRVWHEGLWKIMNHFGIQPKLIQLIENLYKNTESAVIVERERTEWFKQTVGVRQGCILSPKLFNLFLEYIMREATIDVEDTGANINGRRVNNLRFADDIDLVAELLEEAQRLLNKVDEKSSQFGLEISETKTEWLLMSRRTDAETAHEQITLRGKPLNRVDKFKYLGSTISSDNECEHDIKIRTASALNSMSSLDKIWRNPKISIETKKRLYKTLILPIALYGCETWILKKNTENKLLVFEMAVLRRILGVSRRERIRNEHIRERLGVRTNLVQIVHERQHKWLGHVLRMKNERIAKTVLEGRVDGIRPQGKPKNTWLDTALKRTDLTGTDWKDNDERRPSLSRAIGVARERDEWRELGRRVLGAYVMQTRR